MAENTESLNANITDATSPANAQN